MNLRHLSALVAVVSAGMLTSCGSSSSNPAAETYTAAPMTGANEKPTAVTTPATGTAKFTVNGSSVTYTITMTGLSGMPTGAHIHVGAPDVAGPVALGFLGPFTSTTSITGTCDAACVKTTPTTNSVADVVAQMKAGNAYVNVHTAANPGGEIRAQITAP